MPQLSGSPQAREYVVAVASDAMTEPRTLCWSNPTSQRDVVVFAADAAATRAAMSADLYIIFSFSSLSLRGSRFSA